MVPKLLLAFSHLGVVVVGIEIRIAPPTLSGQVVMPNCRSYVSVHTGPLSPAQWSRQARDLFYRSAHSKPGRKFVEVSSEDAAAVKLMAKARTAHRIRCQATGFPHHGLLCGSGCLR